jgi:hypothetical protein
MASNEDEKRRQEEEARIREILGPLSTEDPKNKRELEEKRAEAENQRKTGNFGLLLLLLIVLSALFAVVRYLMAS